MERRVCFGCVDLRHRRILRRGSLEPDVDRRAPLIPVVGDRGRFLRFSSRPCRLPGRVRDPLGIPALHGEERPRPGGIVRLPAWKVPRPVWIMPLLAREVPRPDRITPLLAREVPDPDRIAHLLAREVPDPARIPRPRPRGRPQPVPGRGLKTMGTVTLPRPAGGGANGASRTTCAAHPSSSWPPFHWLTADVCAVALAVHVDGDDGAREDVRVRVLRRLLAVVQALAHALDGDVRARGVAVGRQPVRGVAAREDRRHRDGRRSALRRPQPARAGPRRACTRAPRGRDRTRPTSRPTRPCPSDRPAGRPRRGRPAWIVEQALVVAAAQGLARVCVAASSLSTGERRGRRLGAGCRSGAGADVGRRPSASTAALRTAADALAAGGCHSGMGGTQSWPISPAGGQCSKRSTSLSRTSKALSSTAVTPARAGGPGRLGARRAGARPPRRRPGAEPRSCATIVRCRVSRYVAAHGLPRPPPRRPPIPARRSSAPPRARPRGAAPPWPIACGPTPSRDVVGQAHLLGRARSSRRPSRATTCAR